MSRPHLKTVYRESSITQNIDFETGELLEPTVEIKEHKIVKHDEKEFFQLYYSLVGLLEKMSLAESKLLLHLSYECDHENRIALPKKVKEGLAEKSGLHTQTINNCLSTLTSKNILIRIGVGYYRINPRYVWKKSSGERDKMLKYILEVECKNC